MGTVANRDEEATVSRTIHAVAIVLASSLATAGLTLAVEPIGSKLVHPGPDGKLAYVPYTEKGDTIPDFSNCGYRGGGVRIPDVPAEETLGPSAAPRDDRARIQEAIDRVSRRPVGPDGFRGAVMLKKGTYRVGDSLRIAASGVVLRGEGKGTSGTTIIATGRRQYAVVVVAGRSGAVEIAGTRRPVADAYVPVGARRFAVEGGTRYRPGDAVLVVRRGNADWIHAIGMDRIAPRPDNPKGTRQWEPFDLSFERTITAVEGNRVTIDAPIACAIEEPWGGGAVAKTDDGGRIERVGVEDLRAVSVFDPSKTARLGATEYLSDEAHAAYLVQFADVKNAWARRLWARAFVQGVAEVRRGSKWVTVQDCESVDPVSVLTGGRRYPFYINGGQLVLVQRCASEGARHAFVVGSRVEGPNVFLDCKAARNYATSEPHHRWSVGGLFDNVEALVAIQDRQWMGSGHGWAGANYVVWNGSGTLVCQKPPTAQNFAIGFVGKVEEGSFSRPRGWFESVGRHVAPRSLYRAQLADRLGTQAVEDIAP
jgi:hypothetical protein